MTPIRVAVAGASGRMGQEVLKLIAASPQQFHLLGALSRTTSLHTVSSLDKLDPQQTEVVVDFSSPDYFSQLLGWCQKNRIPLVSGTTGLSQPVWDELRKASQQVAILHAPNMSLGVAIVNEMIKSFAHLNSYDFAVEEFHHRHKKDAPSGTALHLKHTLERAIGKESQAVSIRGGGIFGIHRVVGMGPEETITVEHTALNRSVFASGALFAAQWIVNKQPGLYTISDVLSL